LLLGCLGIASLEEGIVIVEHVICPVLIFYILLEIVFMYLRGKFIVCDILFVLWVEFVNFI